MRALLNRHGVSLIVIIFGFILMISHLDFYSLFCGGVMFAIGMSLLFFRKPDQTNDSIRFVLFEKLKDKPQEWRDGQAIMNYASELYPKEVEVLSGTNVDCFYDDQKIESFIEALEFELKKNEL